MAAISDRHFIITAHPGDEIKNFRKYETTTYVGKKVTFSASGQYSVQGLQMLQEQIVDSSCCIMDLREESHFFADGAAITVCQGEENDANKGLSVDEIQEREKGLVRQIDLSKKIQASVRKKTKVKTEEIEVKKIISFESGQLLSVNKARSEQEVIQNELQVSYKLFPITDHNMKAVGLKVDELVTSILSCVSSGTNWIHFHCQAGKARSAMAMMLAIILFEAKRETLENIEALFTAPDFHFEARKYKKFKEFFAHFYTYCRDSAPQEISWSTWAKEKKVYEKALVLLPESRKDKSRVKSLRVG